MKTVILDRQWAGYDPSNNWKLRPYRLMTNGKTLFEAVKLGLLKHETIEHYDAGYYCGTWHKFTDATGELATMYNTAGFGFNTWDYFQIYRDINPIN